MKIVQPFCGAASIILASAFFIVALLLYGSTADSGNLTDSQEDGAAIGVDEADAGAASCGEIIRSAVSDSLLAERGLVIETPRDSIMVTLAELSSQSFCLEGPGGFTTSAGSSVTGLWAGVSLPDLLTHKGSLRSYNSVTFVADDGYRMTFKASEILDQSEGTWILAISHNGGPMSANEGIMRTIKIGPSTPMVTGHVSVAQVSRIIIAGFAPKAWSFAMRGKLDVDVDSQTVQSCVSCHGVTAVIRSGQGAGVYSGVSLYRMLAFSDDSLYAPHHQDDSIPSYQGDLARKGYIVDVKDAHGHTFSFDSRILHQNDNVVLALYRDGRPLPEEDAPLVLVDGTGEGREESLSRSDVIPRITTAIVHLP